MGLHLICDISAWIAPCGNGLVSAFVDFMCFDPWMWTFSSAEIPPRNHGFVWMGRSNQMFPAAMLSVDASTKIFTVSVWFGETASYLQLLLPFLSSIHFRLPSVSPGFIYRLRNCRGGDGGRDGKKILKLEYSLASVYCLKKEHTILLFHLCFTHFSLLLS